MRFDPPNLVAIIRKHTINNETLAAFWPIEIANRMTKDLGKFRQGLIVKNERKVSSLD